MNPLYAVDTPTTDTLVLAWAGVLGGLPRLSLSQANWWAHQLAWDRLAQATLVPQSASLIFSQNTNTLSGVNLARNIFVLSSHNYLEQENQVYTENQSTWSGGH